jgi:CHAT domain-containing protein
LIVVPTGPLLSLPLGVLITKPAPTTDIDGDGISWLARQFAISVLPSVRALLDLRATTMASAAPHPFIGFGDPKFGGVGSDPGLLVAAAGACRKEGSIDPAVLRALPRLAETGDELKRIARALGAGSENVLLGSDATETKVRQTDLRQYKVVAFATHALLPGEAPCQIEPGLALTPPAVGSQGDDGLLDAAEIAQLRLDADLVILSACNTAGPDGTLRGESLSGLTRAFFYSGARAVLASHWPVASNPTVLLTTGMFEKLAGDPTIGRAEALRRAQMVMLADSQLAHPFFWAAFVLVGDGAR